MSFLSRGNPWSIRAITGGIPSSRRCSPLGAIPFKRGFSTGSKKRRWMIYFPAILLLVPGGYTMHKYYTGDQEYSFLLAEFKSRFNKGNYSQALVGLTTELSGIILNDIRFMASMISNIKKNGNKQPLIAEKAPVEDIGIIPIVNDSESVDEISTTESEVVLESDANASNESNITSIDEDSVEILPSSGKDFWAQNSGYTLIERCLSASEDIQTLMALIKPYMSQNTEDISLYNQLSDIGTRLRKFVEDIEPSDDNDPRYAKLKHIFTSELDSIKKKYAQIHEDEKNTYAIKLRIQNEKLNKQHKDNLNKILSENYNGVISTLSKLEYELGYVKSMITEYIQSIELKGDIIALRSAVSNIRKKMFSDESYNLLKEREMLKRCKYKWSTVSAVIDSIPEDVWVSGVTTKKLIEKELSSISNELIAASFLGPNSGIISHIVSSFLCHLVISRSPESLDNDISSVIARANYYLKVDDMESFVKELNSLTGWQRIISRNCMINARRRLELTQAINFLDDYSLLLDQGFI